MCAAGFRWQTRKGPRRRNRALEGRVSVYELGRMKPPVRRGVRRRTNHAAAVKNTRLEGLTMKVGTRIACWLGGLVAAAMLVSAVIVALFFHKFYPSPPKADFPPPTDVLG